MTHETPRGMWGALRPAIRRTSAEELLQARQAERQAQPAELAQNTGAFGRIAADIPTVAENPDLPTGSVPVVPARSKLREQGVGSQVRTHTNVSTGFVPLIRDSQSRPKNPTLSDLNRETMQKAAEAATSKLRNGSAPDAASEAHTTDRRAARIQETPRDVVQSISRKYRTETTRTGQNRTVADPNAPLSSLAASPEAAERAAARQDAVQDRPRLLRLRATLIALTVPLSVLMIAIRAIASAPFLWIEYHRPGFPEDSYGYDLIERMRLGSYGLDYINNFAPPEYLARVTTGPYRIFAFTEAEVNHMHDVKWVLLIATVAVLALFLMTLISSISLRERAPGVIRRSLFAGTWITLGLILILGTVGALGWEWLFTTFHRVFFPQGNWEFSVDSSLIRLYPPQFWIDAAIAVAVLVLLQLIILLLTTWPTTYRKLKAERRRNERHELRLKLVSARVGEL